MADLRSFLQAKRKCRMSKEENMKNAERIERFTIVKTDFLLNVKSPA